MTSQIDKWNARKGKTEELQKKAARCRMMDNLDRLSYDDLFALANRTDPEDKEMRAKITHALSQKMLQDGKLDKVDIKEYLLEKYKAWLDEQKKFHENRHNLSEQTIEALVPVQSQEKFSEDNITTLVPVGTMSVAKYHENEVDDQGYAEIVEPEEISSWIQAKKEFWEKFATEKNKTAEHDVQEKSYGCTLKDTDDKPLGSVHYESPTAAQVSKDADLIMYQGLVKDAAANNLSITFGESLDNKQKALLLAAILIHGNENGKKIEMINAPKIDLNADYFKELPAEAQAALRKQAEYEKHLENMPKRKNSERQGLQNASNNTLNTPNQTRANPGQKQPLALPVGRGGR